MAEAPGWLDRLFESAVTVDANGIGHVRVKKLIAASDDSKVSIEQLRGHVTRTDDTPLDIEIISLANGNVVALDAVVTFAGDDEARIKVTGLATAAAGVASLVDTPLSDKFPAGSSFAATFVVAGSRVYLRVTGAAATDLTIGFETRSQRQVV